ncbi:GAF domain-containing protein [Sulfidibacter corallicola]|uniref:GAF domain-containing protein n=1 Tax=Sulfidibacter corallicola TaxID=2818388 RepID=A0A8A4TN53_SULCO|nr:HD domain-containing phosphohydrolase [Sulfidibacter corallicola]QTD50321.1 GAF domain-containing protein [Sulfidibacter corallicola]
MTRQAPSTLATLLDRPVLTLTVESGPDYGKSIRFDQPRITLGRAAHNDFTVRDLYVSGNHGVFLRSEEGFWYKDLNSSHGTQLEMGGLGYHLHRDRKQLTVLLSDHGVLRLGATSIHFEVERVYHSERERGASGMTLTQATDDQFMASSTPRDAFSHHFGAKDKRLRVLFKLANQLNGLSHLDKILELVSDAAFQAFGQANLFAISLLHDGRGLQPILVRTRDLAEQGPREVAMSRSMLERVVRTRETVLFFRGEEEETADGGELTESIVQANISACMCAPLVGQKNMLGVMMVDTRQSNSRFNRNDLDLFCVLASNVAFALERAKLTEDIYRMFEGFVEASVVAIESRDPVTAGHSERVAKYSLALAEAVNQARSGQYGRLRFSSAELTELRYAALLHDFGKVGVREGVLSKSERLTPERMALIEQRFAYIRGIYRQNLLEDLVRDALSQCMPPDPELYATIDMRVRHFSRQLDEDLEFIREISSKWTLTNEDIVAVRKIGGQRISLPGGHHLDFLTPVEVEHLTTRVGSLTEDEWEDMRSHVSRSEEFLKRIPWSCDLINVPDIAGAHHEKLNGSGYPRGISASDIPARVRILTIADIFDAVTSWDRPYCSPLDVDQTVALLERQGENGELDRDLVQLFKIVALPRVRHLVPQR